MRTTLIALITLTTATAATAADITPYYNPANSASETGVTIGTNLYKTIGCPGRALLDKSCDDTMNVPPAVVVEAVIPAPVPVVEEKTLEVATQAVASQPVPAPVIVEPVSVAPAVQAASAVNPTEECYEKYLKPAADAFQSSWMAILKTSQVAR